MDIPNSSAAVEEKDDMEVPNGGIKLVLVNTGLKAEYIKTRQGNVRCFPHCCKDGEGRETHNERSFCGDSLVVHMLGRYFDRDLALVGEFRAIDKSETFALGQRIQKKDKCLQMVEAKLVVRTDEWTKFSFNPPRKWEHKKTRPSLGPRSQGVLQYVFTMYCTVDGVVSGILNTSAFVLTPIWKVTSDETASASDQTVASVTSSAKSPANRSVPLSNTSIEPHQNAREVNVQRSTQQMAQVPLRNLSGTEHRSPVDLYSMAFPLITQVDPNTNSALAYGAGPLRTPPTMVEASLSNSPFSLHTMRQSPQVVSWQQPPSYGYSLPRVEYVQPNPPTMAFGGASISYGQPAFTAPMQMHVMPQQQQPMYSGQLLSLMVGQGAMHSLGPMVGQSAMHSFGSNTSHGVWSGFAPAPLHQRQVFGPIGAWSVEQQKAFSGAEESVGSNKRSKPLE